MAATYVASRIAEMPPILRGPRGVEWCTVLGAKQDAGLPLIRVAAVSDLPHLTPDDAITDAGKWSNIDRYDVDSNDSYRARVIDAFPTWIEAGAATSIEKQLVAFGIPDVRVYAAYEGSFSPDPLSGYSHFWIVLGPDWGTTLGIAELILGTGPGGEFWILGTGKLGTTASAAQIKAIKRIILKWKAAHGYPVKIISLFGSGPVLGVGPLTLGSFTLGGMTAIWWPIGKTLGDTLELMTLGTFTLGGYLV
jgi:hypothetical protein